MPVTVIFPVTSRPAALSTLQEKLIAATVSASRSKAKEILSKEPTIAERILNKGRDKLAIDFETKQTNLISD